MTRAVDVEPSGLLKLLEPLQTLATQVLTLPRALQTVYPVASRAALQERASPPAKPAARGRLVLLCVSKPSVPLALGEAAEGDESYQRDDQPDPE